MSCIIEIEGEKLINNNLIFNKVVDMNDGVCFKSFLPKAYWQKRGLYLLLKHPEIAYVRLPDKVTESIQKTVKQELRSYLNPIKIAQALEKEQPQWLAFYLEYEFGLSTNQNPLDNEQELLKLIKIQVSKIKHGSKKSLINSFIAPIQISLKGLLQIPKLKEKVRTSITIIANDFFNDYNVFKLICYLEYYSIENNKIIDQNTHLLASFNQINQLLNLEFTNSTILAILEHLKKLQKNFVEML